MNQARLAVDIGGTFTDFALEIAGKRFSRKVLTTPRAPEAGVLAGIDMVLQQAGIGPASVGVIIHGTTLATNAIIERRGAATALVVTEGFRDSIEMAYENRFEQYDIFMEKPEPLIPRHLRLGVAERIDARGNIVVPLDEAGALSLVQRLRANGVTSIAIGFLHSYVNPTHEERARDLIGRAMPELSITLSCEVCPEMREYERWSTACANAYVKPVMDRYLKRLEDTLAERGFACPIFLMTSAGGLMTVETARQFPIRLVESGPAGGAILATRIARERGVDKIVSFDMGGTTAKLCLIDDGRPQFSRSFEVARQYRFLKGSGIPIRIPAIEMVEIGAGGGSLATVDPLGRIQVGPESASSEPGPACYGRGGVAATVTDADLVLGRIDAARFAGGSITLHPDRAAAAVETAIAKPLGLATVQAALGVSEVVEENMANAARVHAVERGKEVSGRTMVAFGGAAPLHAARLAEKLGVVTVVVPTGAGVGSALGFLIAPVAYEVVRTRYVRLDESFDPAAIDAFRVEMRAEAEAVVRRGAPEAPLTETWTADMRYCGQGHEVSVELPSGPLGPGGRAPILEMFAAQYTLQFGRVIPGLDVEALSWALRLATAEPLVPPLPPAPPDRPAVAIGRTRVADPLTGDFYNVSIYVRDQLPPGSVIPGPALIIEDETTTLVTAGFVARIDAVACVVLTRKTP
jgi:N-methylhydantoinase A